MIRSIINNSRDLINAINNIQTEINSIDVAIARLRTAKASISQPTNNQLLTWNSEISMVIDSLWQLPAADGAANQILFTDGAGTLDWVDPEAAFTTLTSGYLPYYNGTRLADSLIYYDGTDIGIGTTTPNAVLHVVGTPAGGEMIRFEFTGGAIGEMRAGGAGTFLGTVSNHYMGFMSNNVERLRVTAAGRVGIGETAPSALLHVKSGTLSTLIRFEYTGGAAGEMRAGGTLTYLGTVSNHPMGFMANNDEKFRVTVGGDVGISTTSPLARLDVSWGGLTMMLGADSDAKSRTDNTEKYARLGMIHYDTDEEGSCLLYGFNDSDENRLYIGGGTSSLNAATSIRFHTAANNTTLTGSERVRIDDSGMVIFYGTAGLVFGSCYGNHIGWSQANAIQNTWYNISDANMASGPLNGVTHDGNGKLTVTEEGMYLASYSCCFEDDTANDHIEVGLEVSGGGSAENAGQSHVENKFANEEEHVASSTILDLADNATVEVAIRTTDAGTPTISVQAVNLTLTQIGGT